MAIAEDRDAQREFVRKVYEEFDRWGEYVSGVLRIEPRMEVGTYDVWAGGYHDLAELVPQGPDDYVVRFLRGYEPR